MGEHKGGCTKDTYESRGKGAVDGLEKGAEIQRREMAPRHPVRNEGCLHLSQAATSTCCGTQHCSAIGRVSKHSGNNPAATTFVFPRAGGGR